MRLARSSNRVKIPFPFTVPNFHEEVSHEQKPEFILRESARKQRAYVEEIARERRVIWACQTACVAVNWLVVLTLVILILHGPAIGTIAAKFAKKAIGE